MASGIKRGSIMIYEPSKDRPVYNLNVAYDIVREKLTKINVESQCENSGAELQSNGTANLRYLNQVYNLNIKEADASLPGSDKVVSLRDKILLLHYFVQAKGTPLTQKQITYRDLPGGLVYFPTFTKRTVQPLVETFGDIPRNVIKAGEPLGATNAYMGDASLLINAFPRVPVYLLLWASDTELPPGGNILFNSSIVDYLDPEDVTVVCETIVWRLINYSRSV
jgi:hypothetical protein